MSYSSRIRKQEFFVSAKDAEKVFDENYLSDAYCEFKLDDDGNIVQIKLPEYFYEEKFLSRIAPYVKSGSYIEMVGEEGYKWRWVFKNGEVKLVKPIITWPDV